MRNRPTFATSFAAFSEARPDLTQLAGKVLMKMDNLSYVSTPSRPYARSSHRGRDARVIVTTTPSVEGRRVVEYLGLVTGEVILGANAVRDFLASVCPPSRSGT